MGLCWGATPQGIARPGRGEKPAGPGRSSAQGLFLPRSLFYPLCHASQNPRRKSSLPSPLRMTLNSPILRLSRVFSLSRDRLGLCPLMISSQADWRLLESVRPKAADYLLSVSGTAGAPDAACVGRMGKPGRSEPIYESSRHAAPGHATVAPTSLRLSRFIREDPRT